MQTSEARYAKTADGLSIAFQVVGAGDVDLLWVPGYQSNIELNWELPAYTKFLLRLGSFSRLIIVDRRGIGLSDRLSPDEQPPLETLVDDLLRVLDELDSKHAAVMGYLDGGYICSLLAGTYPDRINALILYGTSASGSPDHEYPWQWADDRWEDFLGEMASGWGTQQFSDGNLRWYAPSAYPDEATRRWWARYQRLSGTPGAAVAIERLYRDTDIRSVLPAIRVPTLVLHRREDPAEPVEGARFIAREIPGARYVELEGVDSPVWAGNGDAIVAEVQEFLTGIRPMPEPDRVLATVMFTDIVGSTERIAHVGDEAWRDLLAAHHRRVREQLDRFRGREVDTAGDGFLATFDGPARAVRCARAVSLAVRDLGIEIRAGAHTGELELMGDDVGGIAVHIGARVAALAGPNEVLVSSTVKDLVAGSGLVFEDAGEHELRGVPDRWRLYRVVGV